MEKQITQTEEESKMAKIIPNIPKKWELENGFPPNYQNTVQDWGFFSKQEIEGNKGKLLMLDIDFGRGCSLNCPACFRKNNPVDDVVQNDLSHDEFFEVIRQAKNLGLRTVKICGAGEPMYCRQNELVNLVSELTNLDIGTAIFTKGLELAENKPSYSWSKKLCQEFFELKTSILLNCQSFNPEVQDQLVGEKGYAEKRNRAIINLVEAGFTSTNPTRLALHNAPISKTTYSEIFDIYVWARERNIFPSIAALMTSGKQLDENFLHKIDISDQQKIDLWIRIYSWNIEHGIQTLAQIEEEGISAMPGIHPCNQIACGLYLTLKGNVVSCPGSTEVIGNVRVESLARIWEKSQNYKLAGTFNCKCPPKDGKTIPVNLYEEVMKNLQEKY